jgi:undecaprenyl-diphosphatase
VGWLEAIVLGIVQGLTEFIPVSSSAHLRLTAAFAGWDDPGAAFTAVSQIGTEMAVVVYFWHKITAIVRSWFLAWWRPEHRHDPDTRIGWLIIVGTIPIVVFGLLFEDTIETVFRDLRLTGTVLIGFGLLLLAADHFGAKRRGIDDLTIPHGLGYGLAQSLALIPGVSRSGGTITAGLALGYKRPDAAEYAFLLAVPAVFGSGVYKLKDIGDGAAPAWGPTILATVVAFVVGYVVIAWLMNYLRRHSFLPFVLYRVALGSTVIALVSAGVLAPEAGPQI